MNESTKAVIDQPVLWSSNVAWIYPAVGVNARGHIAGPVFSGGGTSYPTLNVFIWDDLSPDPLTSGWETYGVVTSTNGPTLNKWGDYLASRPQSPNSNTWIGTGYSLQGGGANSNARPRFLWFGRERDTPSSPYGATYSPGTLSSLTPNQVTTVAVTVTNTGSLTWGANSTFHLAYHWYQGSTIITADGLRTILPQSVGPGQSLALTANLQAPTTPGTYTLKWDMVHEAVTWFSWQGVATGDQTVTVQ